MKNKHVDAIVVGAGAGGGVVAKELSVNGIKVVLFERGVWPVYDKQINDELTTPRAGVFKTPFGPDETKHPRVGIVKKNGVDTITNVGGHIGNCVGGGTVTYGAMAWRYMPEDFKMKSVYGPVKGSTLEDWPITYDDLEPYYEKAEWEIGVSGNDSLNPFAPPRKKDFPMPAFENNEDGLVVAEACKRLGLHPFPIPMARNSVPYNGRPACIRNRTCISNACPIDAKNGSQNTVVPVALKSGNCELRLSCNVSEIIMGDNGKAIGVKYFDENDQEAIQTADIVIIAASAMESARLLLNTKTARFPNGLGNNNDWVGRNLQSHAYTFADGIFDKEIQHMNGPGATFVVCDYNHHNKEIIGGGIIVNGFYLPPYAFSNYRPPASKNWGIEHKSFQRDNFFKYTQLKSCVQEMPNFDSRVFIYDKKKDYWGNSIIGVSGGRHPLDHEHCKFLSDKMEEILLEAGAVKTWQTIPIKGFNLHVHQAGTCRMGDDPATSVVNKYGQVHDIENLYVADAAPFVTCGGFNPALTIMALGYWIGQHIVKKYKV